VVQTGDQESDIYFQVTPVTQSDVVGDPTYSEGLYIPIDTDLDGVGDPTDNCPLVANPGQEDNGLTTIFTKANYADWTLSVNQDCITPGVCLTRKNSQGIYNAVSESGFD
jgi:hypothetical protein